MKASVADIVVYKWLVVWIHVHMIEGSMPELYRFFTFALKRSFFFRALKDVFKRIQSIVAVINIDFILSRKDSILKLLSRVCRTSMVR